MPLPSVESALTGGLLKILHSIDRCLSRIAASTSSLVSAQATSTLLTCTAGPRKQIRVKAEKHRPRQDVRGQAGAGRAAAQAAGLYEGPGAGVDSLLIADAALNPHHDAVCR